MGDDLVMKKTEKDSDTKSSSTERAMELEEGTTCSTPKKTQKNSTKKLKKIGTKTRPEDILNTLQNHNLAPEDWDTLADQLLKSGVQKATDEIDLRRNPKERGDEKFDPPPGFSDDSSQEESKVRESARPRKNKESSRWTD